MPTPLKQKFTLSHLREARAAGRKIPMLTCYDFTTARLMQEAGVPALLVGDSAANVILGYPSTLPPGVQESRLVVCKVNGIRCTAIPGSTRNAANHTVSAPITGFSEYGVIESPDPFDFLYRAGDGIYR